MENETYRIEGFSDGVFSIAVTLLVLDLKVPVLDAADSAGLLRALAKEWPTYLAFTATFVSVLIMWINHRGIFRSVKKASPELLFANGLLMLLTTVTPFTTALVARFLRTPAASAAVAVYCGSFVLISLSYNWLWRAASQCSQATGHHARVTRNYRLGLPIYCAATAAAFIHPLLALAICAGLWVFWAATMREA